MDKPDNTRRRDKSDIAFYTLLLGLALTILYVSVAPILSGDSHHGHSADSAFKSQSNQSNRQTHH